MRLLLAALYFLLLLGASAAYGSVHCKSEKALTYAQQIARLDPKFDLDLLDVDLFEGGSAVAGYKYQVEPAYTNGLYSRTDKWKVALNAVPGRLLRDGVFDVKLNLGPRFSTEATFIRFVQDPCEAMTLLPYSPRRMPLRSKTAIGKEFGVGDYFLFRGQSGLVASAEILGMISSGFWGAGFSGHYLLEAFYQLQVVRLDDTKIRLKVLGHRGNTKGASLNLGWQSEFEVFQIGFLDNGLEKLVNTTPLKVKADWNSSRIFLLDYILDLADPKVAKAFDNVIAKAKSFRQLRNINPFKEQDEISGMLLLDLSPLEELFQEDRMSGRSDRISRNLRTSSSQRSRGWGLDLGNSIFGWEYDKETSTSFIDVKRDDNKSDHYVLRTWSKKNRGRFFWTWSKASSSSGLRALFQTDENMENPVPVNIVSYLRKERNRLRFGGFQDIKMELKKALPHSVFNKIPWESWGQGKKEKYTNFGLRYDFIMAPQAIANIPQMTPLELANRFLGYTFKKGITYRDYFNRPRRVAGSQRYLTPKEQFDKAALRMGRKLAMALDPLRSLELRLKTLSDLRGQRLFKESGLGFLMSLSPESMRSNYHFNLNMSSNEAIIDFAYGDSALSRLYSKLLVIKAALDDDRLDILREAESLSTTR